MAENLESFPINFLLAGLFVVCMMSFAIGIAGNYDHGEELMTADEYDYTAIHKEINDTNQESSEWLNSFREDNPTIFYGGMILLSVWGFVNNILQVTHSLWSVLSVGISDTLGIDPLVLGIIGSIIAILLIVYGWKKIVSGY